MLGTPLPHTITKRGDHHLRNRAAIQRPVYFRDSFFALEDAIAYAKMQSKHMERKRKVSTTQPPSSKAPSKSAQNLSNNQNHKSPTPSPPPPLPPPSPPPKISSLPQKVSPPSSHKSPDKTSCQNHNDSATSDMSQSSLPNLEKYTLQ